MSKDTRLPCSSVPGGCIRVVLTDYNWQSPEGETRNPTKTCVRCKRVLFIGEFIDAQRFAVINRQTYSVLYDTSCLCRACDASTLDFHPYFVGKKLFMRLELHDSHGILYKLWDPQAKKWGYVNQRGLRKMTDKWELRLQPRADRQHDKDGNPYGRC